MNPSDEVKVRIVPWSADDQPVLERSNTPEMTVYLGGPESPEKIVERQSRFLRLWQSGEARMFTIRVDGIPDAVGSVGYWTTTWHDAPVYESGWSIATAHQGRGFASKGLAACLEDAADHGDRDTLVAFPRIDNGASNALCRSVGFEFAGVEDFEYPAGNPIKVHAWRFDLARLRDARREG
ncbi:GNAT family N-acetyltransferase [Mycetocola miduiensis]|uniref:Protein N-acetyltransferase, RimJ/RimL family n=1 Tax=Mycetocola miduiensis TaxID=995034 RepID=A0A1I5ABD8_9MICO|nr:GNAT family N-acetyltransferase [Mycetocola miduiensis]SFN59784.1 Protein N-acetyltransferase, RimJ/RimL family [Mycetocola miduiensis]